jgi:dipeptidyl aminopeptidase/acylaminoacyl peptidase
VYRTNSTTPGIYYLGDRDHKTLAEIAHTYPQLEGKLQGRKKIVYSARDGKTIEGYLTLPKNHDLNVPSPAVIFPHGGPMARDYGDFDYWAEFFASKGLIVLQPNFRGSSGYGREFELEAIQNMGLTMQDDLTDAANWLLERKLADPNRLAIAGGSYGGYAALMGAVKTPDLFKCAISFAGISDLIELRNSKIYYVGYEVVREQFGRENEKLEAVSPIKFLDKIKIPILLVHGDEDRTVFVEQSRKMANALKNKNKIYTYVELEKGDHYLSLQENRHKFFNAMDEFLDKHLLK